jgi:hypothetical protein
MLEYAKKYEDKLRELFFDIAFDPFYQFEQMAVYRDTFELPKDTWSANNFVSVYDGNILGIVGYQIRRIENAVNGLYIAHFGGPQAAGHYIFGKDIITAIKDIFEKYRFNKLNFTVVRGNPIEKTYDKLIKRYSGRIVGVREQETKLLDGRLYDVKEYEILAERYFTSFNTRRDRLRRQYTKELNTGGGAQNHDTPELLKEAV